MRRARFGLSPSLHFRSSKLQGNMTSYSDDAASDEVLVKVKTYFDSARSSIKTAMHSKVLRFRLWLGTTWASL